MADADDLPLTEEIGKAWVLDAIEALDDASFVFVMSSIGAPDEGAAAARAPAGND